MQRDGKYFLLFSGTVTNVARLGHELTVQFKDGDRATLNPPSDMMVDIAGTMIQARKLPRGQELTLYVPQDQFVAEVPEGESVSAPLPISHWEPQRVAEAASPSMEPAPPKHFRKRAPPSDCWPWVALRSSSREPVSQRRAAGAICASGRCTGRQGRRPSRQIGRRPTGSERHVLARHPGGGCVTKTS